MKNNSPPELIKSLLFLKELVENEFKDKVVIWKLDEKHAEATKEYLNKTRNTILLDSEFYTRAKFAGALIDPTDCVSYCVGYNGRYTVIRA
jgi:hypothetical protein